MFIPIDRTYMSNTPIGVVCERLKTERQKKEERGGGDGGLIVATITTTDIGVKARGVETTKRLVVVVMVWLGCECHRRRPMAVPSKWRINVLSSVEQV